MCTIEPVLVDGLRGADVAHFGRPVSSQDEQWYAGASSLDDSREKVCGGCAGGAQKRDRLVECSRKAEGEERARPFVDVHPGT
jgi:hypothetical protein